jgi:hypothetical protein
VKDKGRQQKEQRKIKKCTIYAKGGEQMQKGS